MNLISAAANDLQRLQVTLVFCGQVEVMRSAAKRTAALLLILLSTMPAVAQEAPSSDWQPRSGTSKVFGLGYQALEGPARLRA